LQKKSYKIDSSNNLDCSKNIKYLNSLIEKNDVSIKKLTHTEDEKKSNEILEENKISIDEENNPDKDKRKNFFNSKGIRRVVLKINIFLLIIV
jgi:hypothetical protein